MASGEKPYLSTGEVVDSELPYFSEDREGIATVQRKAVLLADSEVGGKAVLIVDESSILDGVKAAKDLMGGDVIIRELESPQDQE